MTEKLQAWINNNTGMQWDSPKDFLWISILGGCGCWHSELFSDDAWFILESLYKESTLSIMESLKNKDSIFEWVYQERHRELLLHIFDDKGLIDHGSSIAGSWITVDGKGLYEYIINNF